MCNPITSDAPQLVRLPLVRGSSWIVRFFCGKCSGGGWPGWEPGCGGEELSDGAEEVDVVFAGGLEVGADRDESFEAVFVAEGAADLVVDLDHA